MYMRGKPCLIFDSEQEVKNIAQVKKDIISTCDKYKIAYEITDLDKGVQVEFALRDDKDFVKRLLEPNYPIH